MKQSKDMYLVILENLLSMILIYFSYLGLKKTSGNGMEARRIVGTFRKKGGRDFP
jgi:hypothetical protein